MTKLENIFWNDAEHRLRGGWRLTLQLIAQLVVSGGLSILAGLVLFLAMLVSGNPITEEALLSSPLLLVVNAVVGLLGIVPVIWIFGRWIDKRKFSDFGFVMNRDWWLDLGFGLLLGAVLMALIFVVQRQLGWVEVVVDRFAAPQDGNFILGILQAAFLFLAVGFYEELMSRGYQLKNLSESMHNSGLSRRWAIAISLVITSLVFGILHATNPNASLVSTLNIALAGIFLGLGMVLTGSLAIPIGLHITWNFFQGNVFGFPVSGTNAGATFLQINQSGPAAWTGGNFGPEAGYIGLLTIVLGSLLSVVYVRLRYGKVRLEESLAVYQPRVKVESKGEQGMKTYQAQLALDARVKLGEGPAWDARTGKLLWVNIMDAEVHVFDPKSGEDRVIDLSDRFKDIGTVAPTSDPNQVIIAPDLSIALLNLNTEEVEILATVEGENERFNDGKCGPAGNFIVGTMHDSDPLGKLYNFTHAGGVQFVQDGVKTSNGLGWSPDYRTMYYVDSKYKEVYAFDYDLSTGALSNKRVALPLPEGDYSPDGLTTDKEGMLWLAHWRGYCLTRWNPNTGEMIARVEVPAPQVTSCCFGGDDGTTLFITSARSGLDEETLAAYPHAGSLFVLETGIEGQPSWPFQL
jgi:uncharacterized protein